MATVRIPPVLRAQTGGQPEVEAGGSTVGEVLRSLTAEHPDDRGASSSATTATSTATSTSTSTTRTCGCWTGLDTAVSDGDTVVILPAMAGGAR